MINWDTCLNYLFEDQVNLSPNHIAASIYDKELSYRELNEKANQCANYMRSIGVGPDSIVAILMERRVELIVAMMGVLKAGGAYLPLDPTYPQQRIDFILEDANVSVVLTSEKFKGKLLECDATVFCVDTDMDYIAEESIENPTHINQSDNLAYIIYTSGSTGVPKGCMIEHKSICNRILWMQKEYQLTTNDRVLQKTPYTFDVSVWEFFWTILTGAQIVFAKPDGHKDSNYLVELVNDKKVTVCHFVPSMLKFFVSNKKVGTCTSLRYVFTSGEALSYELMLNFKQNLGAQLHNLYGPTEAAVDVTYWACEERRDGIVPIGKAIDNINMYVLDENLEEVKKGQEAGIYIGGIGLARGYLNRKELTDKFFIINPHTGERIYRTGDIGRFLDDGNIEYIGREDSQVKLRGNRIELGEIENVLKKHSAVEDAILCVKDEKSEDPKLVAYVITKQEMPQSKELREFLKDKLPDYMLPNYFVSIDELPVTLHGKLNRKVLPWPISNEKVQANKQQELVKVDGINKKEAETNIISIVKRLLLAENITSDADLFDLGATSLTMVQIVEEIDKKYNITIPIDLFLEESTIDSLSKYIVEHSYTEQRKEQWYEEQRVEDKIKEDKIIVKRVDNNVENHRLLEFIREIINEPKLNEEDDLFDYGATSFTLVQIAEFVEDQYKVTIPIDLILNDPTVNSINNYICSNTNTDTDNSEKPIEGGIVSFGEISKVLSLLKENDIDGEKRYLYPSAGGLHSIQTYIYIKENQVDGLKRGYYYYHPIKNVLYCIGRDTKITGDLFDESYERIYKEGSFIIFFAAKLDAIEPIYSQITPSLTVLDAGYMTQLLLSHQEDIRVDLYPIVGVDFDSIQKEISLNEQHQFIHCLIGGKFKEDYHSHMFKESHKQERFTSFFDYLKVDETTLLKKMKFMNKEEHDSFIEKQLQLRSCNNKEEYITLDNISYEEKQYLQRESKRQYLKEIVSKENLLDFLSFVKRSNERFKLAKENVIDIYLYVKENGIEGFAEGMYRYNSEVNDLEVVTQPMTVRIKLSHMPFNRLQYEQSSFSIYLIGNIDRLQSVYSNESEYIALLEAGYLGQILMDSQASYGIGLCPIGGINFEKISNDFKLREGQMVLHSYTGGAYCYEEKAEEIYAEGDIAIIGMSGRFSDCDNVEEYWNCLRDGESRFTKMSDRRKQLYNAISESDIENRCAYLNHIDTFDSGLFHISPGEASCIDPQERIFMEVVWECLEDAGYTSELLNQYADKVGVFVGSMWSDYQNYSSNKMETKVIPATALASSIANRVSYYFDFIGPSIAINTSCSSGMTAIHLACESILHNECKAAIVGGINIISHPYHIHTLQQLNLLSDTNSCRPFSANANGWIAGEGAGAIVLKPLKDAKKDKDQILGIIKGTSVGHTGKTVRFGAPKSATQAIGMEAVIDKAGISKDTIAYIETAAPGASLADSSEMEAIRKTFGDRDEQKDNVWISCVKGNIGHLESASAISQVIKVLLEFRHNAIAPTVNMQPINPLINLNWKVELTNNLVPMNFNSQKRVLINSFGATGSSGHIILENYEKQKKQKSLVEEPIAIPVSAATTEQLYGYIERIELYLEKNGVNLSALGETLRYGRLPMKERIVFIITSMAQLKQQIKDYLKNSSKKGEYEGIVTKESTDAEGRNKLWREAYRWINNQNESFTKPNGPYRKISLPTYPFEKHHSWISYPENNSEIRLNEELMKKSKPIQKQSRREQLVQWLIELFAGVSGFSTYHINRNTPLGEYGISSAMIQLLNTELSKHIGNVSKTIFFECDTIDEIAGYLLENNESQLNTLIGGEEEEIVSKKKEYIQSDREYCEAEEDIAIIGIDGIYPQADNIQEFWDNLISGKDCITTVPKERWDYKNYFDTEKHVPGKTYCKWGGFINDVDKFDASFFNISPREATIMDPQERLFLQTSWHALEDAGYSQSELRKSVDSQVGVFVGVMYGEYQLIGANSGQSIFASYSSIANRVSYVLNLNGPSMAVDTMCSSSLTALHLATESIKRGECKMAIVGGVSLSLHPNKYVAHAQMTMSSSDGHCKSFGKDGNGFVPGEGVGAFVIKPLKQAVKDHDNIYGVVKGTAINHGGRTSGYTVPSPTAQSDVILKAWRQAKISPERISYVEAHGTGTILGDPIEINGLTRSFNNYTKKNGICAIGSVKSNIGHLESAAGIAGITKILLQMKNKKLVPSLFAEEINPNIDIKNTPFYIQQLLEDWDCKEEGIPRTAVMSAFGACGSNAHVVIEEYIDTELKNRDIEQRDYAIVLSAKNMECLEEYARRLKVKIDQGTYENISLEDFAYTLQVGREPMEYRMGTIVTSMSMLSERLEEFVNRQNNEEIFIGNSGKKEYLLEEMMCEPEFEMILKKWVNQNNIKRMLSFWVKGANLDWSALYDQRKPLRVSIIGYPFLKKRYWIEEPKQEITKKVVEEATKLNFYTEEWIKDNTRNKTSNRCNHILCWVENPEDRRRVEKSLYEKNQGEIITFLEHLSEQEIDNCFQKYTNIDSVLFEWGNKENNNQTSYKNVLLLMRSIIKYKDKMKKAVIFGRYENELQRCYIESIIGMERTFKAITKKDRFSLVIGEADCDKSSWFTNIVKEFNSIENGVVRYKMEERYVLKLQTCNLTNNSTPKISEGGTYLLTGGLGGIGTAIATYLAKNYHANLLLIGRKEINTELEDKINELKQYGVKILYLSADISKKEELQKAIEQAKAQSMKINGVIQLAGIMGHEDLSHMAEETFYKQVAPKVEGTIWLDQLLEEEELDFMCYFSSSSAIMGDFGTYDYAIANRFQMAYADYRNKRVKNNECFGQTYVINWPVWEASGMAKQSKELERYLEATEQRALTTEEGISLLNQVLLSDQLQILISTREEETRKVESEKPVRQMYSKLQLDMWINQKLKESVGKILKLSLNDVDNQTSFSDLGFDSISLSELSKEVKQVLGITVATSLMWKYFTIDRLQNYILCAYGEELANSLSCNCEESMEDTSVRVEKEKEVPGIISDEKEVSVPNEPIAIIGMSGKFPNADSIDEFWEKIKASEVATKVIPKERWDYEEYANIPCKWGGFINDVDKFDPLFFNMSPKEAELLDPQQRIFLQEAWHALEDAGYMKESIFGSSCGVYVGVEESQYDKYSGNMGGLNSNRNSTLSARIAYELDLRGPNMVINTACSSGLAALSQASQALRNGECDMAIVGGVNLNLIPEVYMGLSKNNLLSTDGKSHVFDQGACGMVPSEAVVSLIIKPLSKAERDKDRIYGCIIGNGINYNGKSNGITAPNVEGQLQLMKQVLNTYKIDPAQIDYVMAHSVGSKFGDPLEIDAIQTIMEKNSPCFIGSIKPLVGHTFAASGLVNLITVLKAMQEHLLIGVSQLDELNDEINLEKGSVVISNHNKEWINSKNKKRLASILATGMSGTNVNVVIEEYEQKIIGNKKPLQETYLIVLSAKTKEALLDSAKALHTYLMDNKDALLRDISYSLIKGRMSMNERVCFIVDSIEVLKQLLFDYVAGKDMNCINVMEGECKSLNQLQEKEVLLSANATKSDLQTCGKTWLNGTRISVGDEIEFNYLSLPMYPFAKRVCWFEQEELDEKLETKTYENEAAKFYTYGTLDKADEFSLEYLTFCPFEEKIPGFSMSRVFLDPKNYEEEYALIQHKQIEMREVLFSCVDFAKVNQLFDFGCGHGTDVMQFAQRYPHMMTCGYTITEAQADLGNERIKKKGLQERVHIYHRDSTKYEFPSCYDVILGIEVSCHIKDKQTLFRNVSNALNEDGSVLLMDFISNLQGRIEDKGIEVSIATKEDWIDVFSTNGLVVEKIIDVSEEIANFLYDPDYEKNTKDMPEVVKKGIKNFANNSIALEKKWTSYCLFQIKKAKYSTMEEIARYNHERFDNKIPYRIAALNMKQEGIIK